MGQVSPKLRRLTDGYSHWCPGCEEMHVIFDRWAFDGNVSSPTFAPSVRITGMRCELRNGRWTGEWIRGQDGKALPWCCHYFLKAGRLDFCADSSHALAGKSVPLPDLPSDFQD